MAHAPKTADVVELQSHPKGFRKKIGKRENGQPMELYFGSDLASAKVAAWIKMKAWDAKIVQANRLNIDPKTVTWATNTQGADLAIHLDNQGRAQASSPPKPKPQPTETPKPTGPTIHTVMADYLAALNRRVGLIGSLGIMKWTYDQTAFKLVRAMEFCPVAFMNQMNFKAVETLIYTLAARPFKRPNPTACKDVQTAQAKEQLSQRTVLGLISEVKAFLIWAGDEEATGWTLPKHVQHLWKIRPEAEEQNIVTVSADQLTELWHGSINQKAHRGDKGELRRLWIALGLNCGFYGIDISTLTPKNIITEGDDVYIWKLRRKTRKTNSKLARTKWYLWPETAALLKKYMPLNGVTPNNIRMAWERLTDATGVDRSHSNLRDTGSMFMERAGGRELADTYLAHSRKGVIDSYSHPDWTKLTDALKRLYTEFFKPAIIAQPKAPAIEAPKPKQRKKAA